MLVLIILAPINASSKDRNIIDYVDRGIHYYPYYVKKGLVKYGKASWYGKPFHGRPTASGERYNMYSMTAAHRTYALNTIVKVTNLKNKKSVKVRINDRGPFYRSRDIDLSYAAAKRLGIHKKGVAKIKLEVIKCPKGKGRKKTYCKTIVKNKKPTIAKRNEKSKRNEKIQVASFFNKKLAQKFREKHKLKNSIIVKKYIKDKKKTAYRVIIKCTPWEAKQLLKSKKFSNAYKISKRSSKIKNLATL